MSNPADNYPKDKPPERPKFDYSLKIHVGIRPSAKPGGKPVGYALEEVEGGKAEEPEEKKP